MNNSGKNSFRRDKRAEDKRKQDEDQTIIPSNNNDQILKDINSSIQENTVATELVADSVEAKNNQVIDSLSHLNKTLLDNQAAAELNAESGEDTFNEIRKLGSPLRKISVKITKLTALLEKKFKDTPEVNGDSSTDEALNENGGSIDNNGGDPAPVNDIVNPPDPRPAPTPEDRVNGNTEENKDKDKDDKKGFKEITKAIKGGFDKSLSVTNKIAGLLFSYTVSALLESAKLAGMLFSIVLAFDVLKINLQYWSKLFEENFKLFNDKLREWAPILESLLSSFNEVKKAFSEGNWVKLVSSIITGVGSLFDKVAEMLLLGISKLAAAILRSVKLDDAADNLEATSLQGFSDRTGAKLSDDNATFLAKYQSKQMQAEKPQEGLGFQIKSRTNEVLHRAGRISDEEYEETKNSLSGKDPLEGMSEDERVQYIKKRNDLKAEMIRYDRYSKEIDPNDQKQVKSLTDARKSIDDKIADPQLAKAPILKATIQKQYEGLSTPPPVPVAKPAPADTKEDAQTVKRIKTAEAAQTVTQTSAPIQSTVNSSVTTNNKTMYNIPPQSSTAAPGMGSMLGTN